MARCLIGLGSNLGDRGALLSAACEHLAQLPQTSLMAISSFHESNPAGGPAAQPPFLNAAVLLDSSLSPQQLLVELRRIEYKLGRQRHERWGPRTIDLDLLLCDQIEIESPELTLPHPRMAFRRFVLEPAAEIAAEMVYPMNGWKVAALRLHIIGPNRAIAMGIDSQLTGNSGPMLRQAVMNHPRSQGKVEPDEEIVPLDSSHWYLKDHWRPPYLFPESFEPTPKLLVLWTTGCRDLSELECVRHHVLSPPVLWIPGVSLDQATQEVIAAMAAME